MIKSVSIAVASCLLIPAIAWSQAPAVVKGVVFLDANAIRLQFTIGGGLMTLQANSRIRMAKPKAVNVDNLAAVTLFAEGGKAEFKKVDITGLK